MLISFNNKPATDTIPFLSPLIAPGARLLGPLLEQLAASPLSATFASALQAAKDLSPSLVRARGGRASPCALGPLADPGCGSWRRRQGVV